MTIKLQEDCYGATVSVNGTDLFQHTQDSIEVNSEVQAQAIKYIIAKLKDDPSLITGVVNELIIREGEYENKGYCEQCCTNEGAWSEEFEGTPKLVSEPSCWTPLGKLHPPEKGKLAIVFPDSEDEMEVLITEVAYSEECSSIGYYWEENGKKQYETFPTVRLKTSPTPSNEELNNG